MLEIVKTCPLGSECEKTGTKDGKPVIERCMWYKEIKGTHPQTGDFIDMWDCAIAWNPLLLVENTKQAVSLTSSVQSNRNAVDRVSRKLDKIPLKELSYDNS